MDAEEAFLCQSLATRFAYAINSKARGFFSAFAPRSPQFFFQWQHVLLRGRQSLALYTNDLRVYVHIPENLRFWAKTFFPSSCARGPYKRGCSFGVFLEGGEERKCISGTHPGEEGGKQ